MSIKKSLAWMGMAQAVSFLLQFVCSVILARYLSPHELGIFAIGMATVAMLSLLQNFGLQPLIVREAELTPAIENTAFTVNAAICALLCCIIFASAFTVANFLGAPGVRQVLLVLSISPLFGILSFLPGAMMEREARFKEIAFITTLASMIAAIATAAMVVLQVGYMSLAYANVISSAVSMALFIWFGRTHFRARASLTEWRRVLGFGGQMLAASGIISLSGRAGEILLGRLLGLAALGLYNRAIGLCNLMWAGIHPLIGRVVLVDFAKTYRAGGSLRGQYITTVSLTSAVLWPAFMGLAVIAHPFIVVVYGQKWESAAILLVYIAISSAILVMSTVVWEVCAVTGNLGVQTRIEALRAVASLGLLVAASFISLEAVALSRIAEAVIAFALYRPHLNRMTDTRFKDFRLAYAQSALLTIGAVSPAFAAIHLIGSAPSPALLAFCVITGIAVWAGLLVVLKHPLAIEGQAVLRNRMPRLLRLRPQEGASDL